MGFVSCLINPTACAANALTSRNSKSNSGNSKSNSGNSKSNSGNSGSGSNSNNSNSDKDGGRPGLCDNRFIRFLPPTGGATLLLDQVCNTNNSTFTNGGVQDGAGKLMELFFGENWLTYFRILIGLIILSFLFKIASFFR